MTEQTCPLCAQHETGDTDAAARIEAIRHRRVLLSVLAGSTDTVAEIRIEIGDCVACLTRLAAAFVAINAGMILVSFGGDLPAAATAVEKALLDYNDQEPLSP